MLIYLLTNFIALMKGSNHCFTIIFDTGFSTLVHAVVAIPIIRGIYPSVLPPTEPDS